jgi:hypothetical protein
MQVETTVADEASLLYNSDGKSNTNKKKKRGVADFYFILDYYN